MEQPRDERGETVVVVMRKLPLVTVVLANDACWVTIPPAKRRLMSARSFKDGRLDRWRATDSWLSSGRIISKPMRQRNPTVVRGPRSSRTVFLADVARNPRGLRRATGKHSRRVASSVLLQLDQKVGSERSAEGQPGPSGCRPARAKTRHVACTMHSQKHWIRD